MKSHLPASILAVVAMIVVASSAHAQGWGTLSGTIKYDGKAPAPAKLAINKDIDFCGKFPLVDESLVVGENGGLKNVIVTMYLGRGDKAPAVHPDYAALKEKPVEFDNDKCRFEPHVAVVLTGQTLQIGNKDTVGHNTKVDTFTNSPINPIIPAGGQLNHTFDAAERLPAKVSCSIHPWMTSWLVIRDDPYVAVTDENGSFKIENVPAGNWTFQFWHEKAGFLASVKVDGKTTSWSRGRAPIAIKSGGTTELNVSVPPAAFK